MWDGASQLCVAKISAPKSRVISPEDENERGEMVAQAFGLAHDRKIRVEIMIIRRNEISMRFSGGRKGNPTRKPKSLFVVVVALCFFYG